MKTLTAVIVAAGMLLAACGSVLDKKFDLKTAKDDYAKIKADYKDEYTPEELAALSNDMATQAIAGGSKTYREMLDTIHADRLKYEAAMVGYNESVKKMEGALSLEITGSQTREGDYGIGDYFGMEMAIKNVSGKNIAAYSGVIEVQALTGTELGRFKQESSKTITVGEKVNETSWWGIFKNVALLQESTTDKLKFFWIPQVIVFEGGEKLEAPQKPSNPLEGPF